MKAKKVDKKIDDPPIKSANLFPVVGIGASAGGLEAFKKLLKAIPEDSGMAYVLVQHLDPNHESLLPEILQKVTKIPVMEITDDIKVEPNHIYVIPANKMMVATDGVLLLAPRPPKSKTERNLPIDLFFTSLAEVHQAHAIGVVLSGTASDGTMGLKAIKDHGGITFAQDEESAAYEGMPHSAAQAGVVDFILPPEKIPQKLLEVVGIIKGNENGKPELPLSDVDVFKQILSLLRIRKGVDFTYYKQPTIGRRILRRMALNKNEEPSAYLKYLRENKTEQDVLYQDMLIPVTSFFRDKKTFDNLCEAVFPHLVKTKTSTEPIRVWVAGCSTGEEAYSIAICLTEFLGNNQHTVQIFATDLSEVAIAKARNGLYSKTELNEVSPQRLQEFFTKNNSGYQVNKNVRDMCVFAHHNFLKDPPFGKMDFISCRNVLIYMEPYLQKKALTTFHYALNPKGFLLLGKSETSSGVPDLFVAASKTDKLFTRKDVPGKFMHVTSQRSEQNFSLADAIPNSETIRTDFQKTADDIMLRKYTPAGVVVNEAMDIVHFRGNTSNYLIQSPGKPSHNLLQMAKNGLAFELRNILHKAKKDKAAVIKENIPMELNGGLQNISIEAMPLPNIIEPHYLILFHYGNTIGNQQLETGNLPAGRHGKKTSPAKAKKDDQDLRIQQLEKELSQAREDMRSITEDQEASNEELQSANEELLSSSEELQSLNEELETGKEELQSTNEELTVVNQEMISINEQLTVSRDYAEAIILNIHEPLLVLDKNLRIKTANNAFYKTFRVAEQETEGSLIYNLGNKQWDIPELRRLLENILPEKSVFNDFEVTHNFSSIGERIMLLNAREVINKNNSEKLILLAIVDITEEATARKKVEESEEQFGAAVAAVEGIVWTNNAKGEMEGEQLGWSSLTGQSYEAYQGYGWVNAIHPDDAQPTLEAWKEAVRDHKNFVFQHRVRSKNGNWGHFSVRAIPLLNADGLIREWVGVHTDISERKQSEIEINYRKALLEAHNEASIDGIVLVDAKGKIISYNHRFIEIWNMPKHIVDAKDDEAALSFAMTQLVYPEQFIEKVKWLYEHPTEISLDELEFKNGKIVERHGYPVLAKEGGYYAWSWTFRDITQQKLYEKNIKQSEEYFKLMADSMPQKVWTADIEGNKTYFNKTLLEFSGLSFEELKGIGWQQIVHPDDWGKDKTKWEESISTGQDYESENRLLGKDGKYLWHLTRAVAIKDDAGNIKMWVGSKTEIQEQKKQKEELQKSVTKRTHQLAKVNNELEIKHQELIIANEKLLTEYSRSLIEASLDPLVTINPEGKITDMNQATVHFTGVSRENLTGTNFFEYFTEPQKARDVYEQVFEKGSVINSPLTLKHIDGKLTDVLLNGSVYKNHKNDVIGVVLVARDVTEEQRAAKELSEAIVLAEMATIIAEDAKQKAEEASHRAEDAATAKQQFLSNMSHEIRTPMNAIIGFTKVILKTDLTPKQREYLNAIKLSGNSLVVLINDILDLAKVEAGKMTFEQIPFKLSSSIAAMIHLFETTIQEKNLELLKVYDHSIPDVLLGDPVRLHQIILNLVSNAVKFTSKGTITVSARLLEEDDEKVKVEFTVSDTGIGIPEDKKELVFQNFQQASSETSRLYGGTGLGLSIVKQLVESQGGNIDVKSKLNEGTTFIFTLSFQKTTQLVAVDAELLELSSDIENIKVLVVEDMSLNQLLMKTILDEFGFERDIAANGKIAIEKMEHKTYDIILMDLQMPQMNGFEATNYIRNTLHSKIPIIALTADVTTVDQAKCKAAGMNDYIAKPIDEKLLYNKIVGLVKKRTPFEKKKEQEPVAVKELSYTNLTYLYQHTKSNSALISEMISIYLDQTPPLVHAMKESLENKDWQSLYAAAHKMIPSFSIIGIDGLYESMAKQIQDYARLKKEAVENAVETDINKEAMEAPEIAEMIAQIERMLQNVISELTVVLVQLNQDKNEEPT